MRCVCLPSAGMPGAMQRGVAQLPDLHVSDSSEAMLSGRKPPFRLLVRAVATDGRTVNIRHAVSEGFVVSRLPAPDACLFCHVRACSCVTAVLLLHSWPGLEGAVLQRTGMREPAQQLEGAIWSARHPTCTRVVHGQVATRRTRTAGKVEIPNVDDHVSKLEHMGKETVKKLQDIRGSAVQCGIDISVPDNCIVKGARPACAWCGVFQQTRCRWRQKCR